MTPSFLDRFTAIESPELADTAANRALPHNVFLIEGAGSVGGFTRAIPATWSIGNGSTLAGDNQRHTRDILYTGRVTQAGLPNEIPFAMQFSPVGHTVTITWNHSDIAAFGGTAGTILRVPLLVQTTGVGEITVEVTGPNSTNVANGSVFPITGAGQGAALTVTGGVAVGRDVVQLNQLSITENAVGGFNFATVAPGTTTATLNRAITLTLPVNYVWNIPGMRAANSEFAVWGIGRGNMFPAVQATGAAYFDSRVINLGNNVNPTTAGAILGIGNFVGATAGEPFIAFSTHPETLQHRMHVVWNGWMPSDTPGGPVGPLLGNTGQINFQGLQITHRDRAYPVWQDNVEIRLSNGFDTPGISGANFNGLAGITGTNPLPVFSFRNWGLELHPVTGEAGEITTRISGRTYSINHAMAGQSLPTTLEHFEGVTRRVRVSEVVPESAWGARDFRFTLTDEYGEVLPEAKIAAVQFNSGVYAGPGQIGMAVGFDGHSLFHNSVPNHGQVHRQIGGNPTIGNPVVTFSNDGHSVSVQGLRANDPQQRRMWLEARFFISTDVNFDGNVYVTLSELGRGIGHIDDPAYIYPNPTIQLAEVNRLLDITSAPTNINIGFQRVDVQDVIITELEPGVLRRDRQIELSLSEFGVASARTEIGFNDITQDQVYVEGHANVASRAALSVIPSHGRPHVRLTVNRASTNEGSEITLSGLHLYVTHAVPFGTYGVMARGNAILDNDYMVLNTRGTAGVEPRQMNSNEPEYRRYAFGGLLFEPYVNVITPGQGGAAALNLELTARVGDPTVVLGGVAQTMTDVNGVAQPVIIHQDRTFLPLRGLTEVFGADVSWMRTDPTDGSSPIRVFVTIGDRMMVFTEGDTEFRVTTPEGLEISQGVAAPFIRQGTTFVPLGTLGQALGVQVTWEFVDGVMTVYFNQPHMGQPMLDAGGEAVVVPTEADFDDYNDYDEYYNDYYNDYDYEY
jgi:hypothetical protein